MRIADDPESQVEEPELDSSLTERHIGAALRVFGLIVLLFAVGAIPFISPDIRAGHHFYLLAVALTFAIGLGLLTAGLILRRPQDGGVPRRK